jgi:hypothetical protein
MGKVEGPSIAGRGDRELSQGKNLGLKKICNLVVDMRDVPKKEIGNKISKYKNKKCA